MGLELYHSRKILTAPVSFLTIEVAVGTGSDRRTLGSELLLAEASVSFGEVTEIAVTLVEDEDSSVETTVDLLRRYCKELAKTDNQPRIYLTSPLFEAFGFFPHNSRPSEVFVTDVTSHEMMAKHVHELDELRLNGRLCCLHSLVFNI